MSTYKISDWVREELLSADTRANPRLMSTIMSLGITAENVAERYGITREKQDELAL
jgi:acetyl-CoA acetyltransferase